MSGAVAAHAAYNGAGTQGLASTNKINDTGDITSVFWNKNDTTRQLLHGSSYIEVVSSGSTGRTNNFGSSRIFTLNNDIDVLSDIFLDIDFALDLSATILSGASDSAYGMRMLDFEMQPSFAYQVIDRVEFMVGTQIWHTLTGDDIRVLNYTSRTEGANYTHGQSLTSDRFFSGTNVSGTGVPVDASSLSMGPLSTLIGEPLRSELVRTIVWIPALSSNVHENMTSFANPSENGYLMAAAPQQSVKIKVTFKSNSIPGYIDSSFAFVAASGTVEAVTAANAKSGFLGSNGGNGGVPMTGSGFQGSITYGGVDMTPLRYPFRVMIFDPSGTARAAVTTGNQAGGRGISVRTSISSVRMFAKQIMLCKEERDQIRNIPNGLPYRVKMSQSVRAALPTTNEVTIDLDSFSLYASHLLISVDMSTNRIVRDVELKLNNSSFSGALPFSLLTNNMAEALHVNTPPSIINGHVSFNNRITYFDSTAIDASTASTGEHPMLVFPLASTAYSGSGVPLNRFDSIRLTIRFTGTPTSLPIYAFSGKTSGITVTCVGETTVLYKGGAATLAMY